MFNLLLKLFSSASVPKNPRSAADVACRTREKAKAASLACVSKLLYACSSDLERLGLIAYLRDYGGDSRRCQLRFTIAEGEIDDALKQIHLSTFCAWLAMPASEQLADIKLYLQDPEDAQLVLNSLVLAGKMAVPPEAQAHEKELFNHQMECIQASLGGSPANVLPPRPLAEFSYGGRFDQCESRIF
jgi:hypothetical protein